MENNVEQLVRAVAAEVAAELSREFVKRDEVERMISKGNRDSVSLPHWADADSAERFLPKKIYGAIK